MGKKTLWEKALGLIKKEEFIKNIRLFDGDVHLHFHFYLRTPTPDKSKNTKGGIV